MKSTKFELKSNKILKPTPPTPPPTPTAESANQVVRRGRKPSARAQLVQILQGRGEKFPPTLTCAKLFQRFSYKYPELFQQLTPELFEPVQKTTEIKDFDPTLDDYQGASELEKGASVLEKEKKANPETPKANQVNIETPKPKQVKKEGATALERSVRKEPEPIIFEEVEEEDEEGDDFEEEGESLFDSLLVHFKNQIDRLSDRLKNIEDKIGAGDETKTLIFHLK